MKHEFDPSCRVLLEGGVGEYEEKKSRFIATVRPCETEEEASAFIEEIKKKYWDARHNCSAYVIGTRGELTRCSDDGEPSGTAGRPMLEVLLGADVESVCVVVTRYFGGVLRHGFTFTTAFASPCCAAVRFVAHAVEYWIFSVNAAVRTPVRQSSRNSLLAPVPAMATQAAISQPKLMIILFTLPP